MPVELPVRVEPEAQEMVPIAGSTAPSIVDSIPLRIVLLLASPYLAGQTQEEAIKVAHRLYKSDRFSSTIDILGEDSETDEECEQAVSNYQALIEAVSKDRLPTDNFLEQASVSMKPSMFSTLAPQAERSASVSAELERAYERIKSVVDFARQHKVRVTLEAEDHRWTDFHLETYFSLINEGYTNLGTVLQSRLYRTRDDLKRFDERMRVRLVIGIYNEHAAIAQTAKPIMKDLLVADAGELANRGVYVEIATHDAGCLEAFFSKVAVPQRLPAGQFETQFLMGVPRKKLQLALKTGSYFRALAKGAEGETHRYLEELACQGTLVRLYLPFGRDNVAGPYCKRRLKANPNMIGYGIKNLLNIQ